MTHKLTLPQALFLLARDDATGKPLGNHNAYIQPAAALTELVMMERVRMGSGRKAVLEVVNTAPTGSLYLDTVLARIADSSSAKSMQYWVGKLCHMRGRIAMIGEELATKGLVESVSAKKFGIFPVTRWPQRRAGPKMALSSDMMKVLFYDGAVPDERTGAIIALANAGHLLKRNFDRSRLRGHRSHIKRIVKADWPGAEAVRRAIKASQAVTAASTGAG
ncbi:MAG: GPP34 family phosphoprotein [Hyphomonadaceae bacterium]